MYTHHIKLRKHQGGAATLIITILIIIAMTIGSFSMINSSTMESRMNANDQRSRQAMQSAQAGIDYFMAAISGVDINPDVVCADDTMEKFGFILNFTGPDPLTGELDFDPATQSAECRNIPFGIVTRSSVWSRGFDDNFESTRTLLSTIDLTSSWDFQQRRFSQFDPGTGDPDVIAAIQGSPIVAYRNFSLQGSGVVRVCQMSACINAARPGNVHNDFGDPPPGSQLVFSGGTGTGSNGASWHLRDEFIGSETPEINSVSADEFFSTFFGNGNTKDDFKALEGTYTLKAGETLKDVPAGVSNVYVPNNINIAVKNNDRIASSNRPLNVLVDGNVSLSGNGIIWANIYAEGITGGTGTGKIMGRLVAEQDVTFTGNMSVLSPDVPPTIPPGDPGGGGTPTGNPNDFDQDAYAQLRSTTIRIGSWREIVN